MTAKRQVEIFSAGCPCCETAVATVKSMACRDCDIAVSDMTDPAVARRARNLGVQSVPAVAIDGVLADCCSERGIDAESFKRAGIGTPVA